jgi:hypothetical protein
MPYTTLIPYPSIPTLSFNLDYYLSTHWPLVETHWRSFGLVSWSVVGPFDPLPDGKPAPYKYAAIVTWKDKESFEKLQDSGEPWDVVMGNVREFSNVFPVLMGGEVRGSG